MRGVKHSNEVHSFEIGKNGISVSLKGAKRFGRK